MEERRRQTRCSSEEQTDSDLGYNDLLLQDLHGVVGAAGLLPHQDDLPKRAFPQELQVVEVIHGLDRETLVHTWSHRRRRGGPERHLSFVVADGGVHLLLVADLDL